MANFQPVGELVKTKFLTEEMVSWPWLRWFNLIPPRLTAPVQPNPPTSATGLGTTGEIRQDGSYLYVCTGANQWRRIVLSQYAPSVPQTAIDAGIVGEMRADENYLYVCVGANQWVRTALATF